ncbi:hypothetical protein B1218_36270, partial [Pseudomonas ogarae]
MPDRPAVAGAGRRRPRAAGVVAAAPTTVRPAPGGGRVAWTCRACGRTCRCPRRRRTRTVRRSGPWPTLYAGAISSLARRRCACCGTGPWAIR